MGIHCAHAPGCEVAGNSALCCQLSLKVLCYCRPWQQLQAALPWTGAAQAKQLQSSIQELWERHSSDDLVSMFLVLIDAYVTKVPLPTFPHNKHRLPSQPCTLVNKFLLWCWLLGCRLHLM